MKALISLAFSLFCRQVAIITEKHTRTEQVIIF